MGDRLVSWPESPDKAGTHTACGPWENSRPDSSTARSVNTGSTEKALSQKTNKKKCFGIFPQSFSSDILADWCCFKQAPIKNWHLCCLCVCLKSQLCKEAQAQTHRFRDFFFFAAAAAAAGQSNRGFVDFAHVNVNNHRGRFTCKPSITVIDPLRGKRQDRFRVCVARA